MNKLCYIEICIDKMDVNKFAKNVLDDIKKEMNQVENPWALVKEKEEDIKLTEEKDFNFGTTIHESLRKDEE